MKYLAPLFFGLLLHLPSGAFAQAHSSTDDVVHFADLFLASLDAEQRHKVMYPFADAAQRARWSNFPTGFVARGGISLKQMNAAQRGAAMKLLAEVLSPMGLQKVKDIQDADDDFKSNGSRRGPPRGAGGRPPGLLRPNRDPPALPGDMFGSDLYYISFLGEPSSTAPWMLQYGGHHLALNITIAGSRGVLTPTLTGAQPASFKMNGKTIRPLGRESDGALTLLRSLDESQRKQAVLSYAVADLVLGPGQDGQKIAPEGLKGSAMNALQRSMLLDLIAEWAGIVNKNYAAARLMEIKADLNDTWFAWSGATDGEIGNNITGYYRIQGPHLVIEYAPQHDEPTNHVHTIYRDPTNDYGRALTGP